MDGRVVTNYTANRNGMCNRCGRPINKGDPIRFEQATVNVHRSGSGRYAGQRYISRPIHAHDCDGWDAAQARAKAATEAARKEK